MTTETGTIADLIARVGLTMTATPAESNPNADADTWSKGASHWRCVIQKAGANRPKDGLTVFYSMGEAHRIWRKDARRRLYPQDPINAADIRPSERFEGAYGLAPRPANAAYWDARDRLTEPTPPTLPEVLDCLASDASGYDCERDFEGWAESLGFDTDSRKAERCYRITAEQAKGLRHLLGDAEYDRLLNHTERL